MAADLSGKICVVTGATSGIGLSAATTLARRGAHLAIVCRNAAKAEATRESICRETGADRVEVFLADLASQADIRSVGEQLCSRYPRIHLLLNNAGITNLRYQETVDGIEATFAVNHLAYFLLTGLLLDRLEATPGARIVCVASAAHLVAGGLNFDDLDSSSSYSFMRVYGRSKLANILFVRELARRLRAKGSKLTANCFHPGFVRSGLGSNNGRIARVITTLIAPLARSPERGARGAIHLATSPEVEAVSGAYFVDEVERKPAAAACDDVAAARLWQASIDRTGFEPDLPPAT